MIGLLEDDVQVLDFDGDVLNGEDTATIFRGGCRKFHVESEPLTTEEEVHNTGVRNRGKSLLLLDVVGDIFQVALDLRCVDRKSVNRSVVDLFASKAEEGVGSDLENVGHQIFGFNNKIFDNCIKHRIADLNSRNLISAMLSLRKRTGTYLKFSKNPGMITSVTSERRWGLNWTLPFLSWPKSVNNF